MKRHHWSEAELNWLKLHINEHSWSKLYISFNQEFNLNLSPRCVESAARKHGISHNRERESGFIKGERNDYSLRRDIGTERIDARGRVYIKIADNPMKGILGKGSNWVQKDRYIWEQAYGKLTTNDLLIHLDNDKSNCELSNLYRVSRGVNRRLSTFGWFFENPTLTLTAIKCCELFEASEKSE